MVFMSLSGHIRIELLHLSADRGGDTGRFERGADVHRRAVWIGVLQQRCVDILARLIAHAFRLLVFHDTDDLPHVFVLPKRDSAADRVLARKVFVRHGLIDHANQRGAQTIGGRKFAACDDRHTDRREERRSHHIDVEFMFSRSFGVYPSTDERIHCTIRGHKRNVCCAHESAPRESIAGLQRPLKEVDGAFLLVAA